MAVDSGPSRAAISVTPSDTVAISPPRGLWVGTGGNLTLTLPGTPVDVVLKNVASGSTVPVGPSFVKTGTTAADIVALY